MPSARKICVVPRGRSDWAFQTQWIFGRWTNWTKAKGPVHCRTVHYSDVGVVDYERDRASTRSWSNLRRSHDRFQGGLPYANMSSASCCEVTMRQLWEILRLGRQTYDCLMRKVKRRSIWLVSEFKFVPDERPSSWSAPSCLPVNDSIEWTWRKTEMEKHTMTESLGLNWRMLYWPV
jgi:hypothetical protein